MIKDATYAFRATTHTTQMCIVLPLELKERLGEVAQASERSLSNLVRVALRKYVSELEGEKCK
jgi:predicted DNA-binding protein